MFIQMEYLLLNFFYQMYDNIASLRFDEQSNGEKVAAAMVSAEGEVMEFKKPIAVEGRVEEWMTSVLLEMRKTNRLITKEAIFHYCENCSRCACVYTFYICVSNLEYVCF